MNFRNYYRRPRETHRCGLSVAGRTCSHGPNGRRCGQSSDVPEKCTPVRTLLGWSRMVSAMFTIAAIITMSYWFTLSKNNLPLAPGGLSKAHAQLLVSGSSDHPLSIDDEKRCAACHPNAIPASSGKIASASSDLQKLGPQPVARKQSELCMNCHSESMPNGLMGNPHDLIGDDLAALFSSVADREPTKISQEPTECSQCHREHQGADGQLQVMTSAKCQACHRKQFESFSNGHPEFVSYPPSKPRSIGFDHARHAELHYSKKGKSFDCTACHLQAQQKGLVGSVFRSVSFEQSCSECHSEPLKSSSIEGLVVLQIPSIDRAKLLKSGHDIGPWPESASLMMDGELSPLLVHMLKSSEVGSTILEKLPKSGKLKDVNLDDPIQLDAIVQLTRFVRSTWFELSKDGQPKLQKWFASDATTASAKVAGTPKSSLDLYARFVATRGNDLQPGNSPATADSLRNKRKEIWADRLATGVPPDLLRAASAKWFTEERLPATMTLTPPRKTDAATILQPTNPLPPTTTQISPISLRFAPIRSTGPTQEDDDLLVDGKMNLLDEAQDQDSGLAAADDLLTGDDDLLLGETESKLSNGEEHASGLKGSPKPLKAWEHLPYGGWMIDENRVALVYVPNGHADPWVARWIEWNLLTQASTDEQGFRDPLLKQCMQCHTFDGTRVQQMLGMGSTSGSVSQLVSLQEGTNKSRDEQLDNDCWQIEQRPSALRELTKFDHSPHLSINVLRDCQSCHKLKTLDTNQVSEQGWSDRGRQIRMEFEPINKDQCATCHNPKSAGEACTQCHNYHVHGLFSR